MVAFSTEEFHFPCGKGKENSENMLWSHLCIYLNRYFDHAFSVILNFSVRINWLKAVFMHMLEFSTEEFHFRCTECNTLRSRLCI